MKQNKCKVCQSGLFNEPVIKLGNMPSCAQYLPDKRAVKKDRGIDLNVMQCPGCGLVQLDSKPVPYYKEVIRASAVSKEMTDFRAKQFGGFVKKYSLKGKKVIEIGCGRGEYLSIIKKTGAKAYGIEQSDKAVKACKKNGLNVIRGFVEDPYKKIKDAPYDAFFMLNILEHLPCPVLSLKGIYNNLRKNSVGIIEVPNFDMMIKNGLFSEFVRDHLLYFTKKTLSTALSLSGFEVISCREIWHDYIISATVRKRAPLGLKSFVNSKTKLNKAISGYLGRFGRKNVAVWGAGHQALAVMSMLNLKNKIKYVVDSAAFKQGKYTPASHIKIVKPAVLASDPVKAVIIMAASYSNEVLKTIRKKYNKGISIAVLKNNGFNIIN